MIFGRLVVPTRCHPGRLLVVTVVTGWFQTLVVVTRPLTPLDQQEGSGRRDSSTCRDKYLLRFAEETGRSGDSETSRVVLVNKHKCPGTGGTKRRHSLRCEGSGVRTISKRTNPNFKSPGRRTKIIEKFKVSRTVPLKV